ncbi:MAG TPA: hypothetical protein VFW69_06080 [Mycobacterium sp.]|nr:hypothetical protein [Mycobacterium sp.]
MNYRFTAQGHDLLATVVTVPELARRTFIELETVADPGDVDAALDVVRSHDPDREIPPYDRVLSTVAASRLPWAWVAQTRPGGLVVTPWSTAYKPAGLLSLTVSADGTASGGLINTTISFMPLRDQRAPRATIAGIVCDTDTRISSVSGFRWRPRTSFSPGREPCSGVSSISQRPASARTEAPRWTATPRTPATTKSNAPCARSGCRTR